MCLLPSGDVPYAVSIVKDECDLPFNMLRVYPTRLQNDRESFALCIQTPMNNNYNDTLQLVEMLEYALIFKAQKIVVYNFSSSAVIGTIFAAYGGNVSLNQWNLPAEVVDGGIQNLARDISINDCLYRMMSYVKYAAFTEIDELLVPRLHYQWRIFVESMPLWSSEDRREPISVYSFQKASFPIHYQLNNTEMHKNFSYISHLRPYTMLKIYRKDMVFSSIEHTKMLVLCRGVEIVGMHFVQRLVSGYAKYLVPEEIGLVYHYNSSATSAKKVCSDCTADRTMFMYTEELVPGMLDRLTNRTHILRIPPENGPDDQGE